MLACDFDADVAVVNDVFLDGDSCAAVDINEFDLSVTEKSILVA